MEDPFFFSHTMRAAWGDSLALARAHDWEGALPEAIAAYETALARAPLLDSRVPEARARLRTLRCLCKAEMPLRAFLRIGAGFDAAGQHRAAAEKYRAAAKLHAQLVSTPEWQLHSPTRLRSWDRMHAQYANRLHVLESHLQRGSAERTGATHAAEEVWSKFDEAERRNKSACAARDAGRYAEAYRLFRETGSLFMGIKRGDFFTGTDRQLIVSHLVHVTMEMEQMQAAAVAPRAAARAARRAPPPLPPRPARDAPLSAEEAANEVAELSAAEEERSPTSSSHQSPSHVRAVIECARTAQIGVITCASEARG